MLGELYLNTSLCLHQRLITQYNKRRLYHKNGNIEKSKENVKCHINNNLHVISNEMQERHGHLHGPFQLMQEENNNNIVQLLLYGHLQ